MNTTSKKGYKFTEEFGYIPNDWEVVKIGDKTNVVTGGTPSTNIPEYWNGNIDWMSSGELNNKRIYEVQGKITSLGLNNSSATLIPTHCVLIGLAGQGKTRGTAAINYIELATNQSIGSILPSEHINSEYLYQSIDKRYDELRELSSGSGGRGGLNKNLLMNLPILLPPLPEQEKIAEVLSDVDSLIDKTLGLINKKKDLKTATMQKLLTPKDDWECKTLGECSKICTGNENNENKIEEGLYPFFVRSENVERINTYSYDGEAILIPGEGGIGKIFHYINGKFNYHQRVYKISDFKYIDGKYAYYYMKKNFGKYALSNTVKATVDSLRLPIFEEFIISCPSIVEQQKIATILSDMDLEIETLEKELGKYQDLKIGIMQQLLTGQVRLLS